MQTIDNIVRNWLYSMTAYFKMYQTWFSSWNFNFTILVTWCLSSFPQNFVWPYRNGLKFVLVIKVTNKPLQDTSCALLTIVNNMSFLHVFDLGKNLKIQFELLVVPLACYSKELRKTRVKHILWLKDS